MTTFIYRGFEHDGHQPTRTPAALDLMYRGASHDGLTTQTPMPSRPHAMRYRGVAYTRTTGSVRPATGIAAGAPDAAAPAHAFA